MKTIIWSLFILVLAVWTGTMLLAAHMVDWMAQSFGNAPPADLGALLETVPMPPALTPWVDPALLASLQRTVGEVFTALSASLPYFSSMMSWLVPIIWVVWGIGALFLLIPAVVGHWLVGSLGRPAAH